ncbi:LRR_1 domain-containing protein/Pkinase_Tyr domain-containing protein/LRRNT_2 domain-containing protein/LRR_8 domain-containing protein [Cephalotus follicularis]|uniref:LRR_1 domain-containing protein/Pkinase_Tyr domain-containing protein/LRRNT_2 domain-containing protein/LRR_8 domain-containing protein n=1 Tax=Cephalotus follicularis TaxID=3775 RepID=A0A1Q3BC62_CEPFO|nr:LRR_1 domain-containing protein/Pkinase_Tyr domain-containing protein/LRRNT_2 domain-containing protein/LRR_8 domain-containing protein [Cephalotus follicularis]
MKLYRLLVFFLLLLSAMGQLPSQDILALLEFKKGIKHDPTGYVVNSWNEESIDFDGCPSHWNGIVCNGGNIAALVLDNLELSADADLSVFSNLTKLVKLSMSNNSISGIIPNNIGEFKSLEFLDVSNNLFSSSLPPGIGKLENLQNLTLAGNNFSGSLPDSISGLVSIRSLDLSRNSFSGSLTTSLTRLNNLVYLNLSLNGFAKRIPRGFELISGIKVIDLRGNMFDGHLDGEFFLLSNASHIDFSGNMLVSSSSQKILPGISESVKYLNLSHNQLTGSLVIGDELQLFENLRVLDLSYNQLSGELPGFNFVYELQVLKLSNNRFSGLVPNNLLKGDTLLLTELDLSANNLSGEISMIMSTTLQVLNLSSNGLMGELPLLTGSCTVLDLSNNQLGGNLTSILKWEKIGYLDLSQNRLTGSIPDVTPQFLRLNYLNLSHNSLDGSLPKAIAQYPKLRVLDLSSNKLDGPLLTDLLTLSTLQELHLENNLFTGAIELVPSSSTEHNLQVLDLSYNQLSGYFPDKLVSLTGLQVLYLAANNLSGSLPTSMADMNSLNSLDLSQNHFTGPLLNNFPNSLGSFNVSYNDLSGTVPETLTKFPTSSFYPGNTRLLFPNGPPGSSNLPGENSKTKPINTIVKVIVIVASLVALIILILLAIFIYYVQLSRRSPLEQVTNKDIRRRASANPSGVSGAESGGASVVAAEDLLASQKGPSSEIITEVLGRSSHGTSYRATLDNGVFLTVKWLREGVAKQRKEFAKEAKKFANIRHPNVVGLRGYYWGPSQHEKLILSDFISPGSLASFLYDRPGRIGPPLNWGQRLKIAVDIARGLNYLHFDRAVPHGNLKATNVLLDGPDLNARVADYCLHRLMTQAGTIEQILDAGVLGYRAPELAASKKPQPSFKSDVYAFGVIILELLTGRCAGDVISGEEGGVDLTDWVRLRLSEGRGADCFDPAVVQEMGNPAAEKGMKEVLAIAVRCIKSVSERPGIKTVYEDLSSI